NGHIVDCWVLVGPLAHGHARARLLVAAAVGHGDHDHYHDDQPQQHDDAADPGEAAEQAAVSLLLFRSRRRGLRRRWRDRTRPRCPKSDWPTRRVCTGPTSGTWNAARST